MSEEYEVRCVACGWLGFAQQLVCNAADMRRDYEERRYDRCPVCNSTDVEDADLEEKA